MHGRDGEVFLLHLLSQPVHLASGVAVDDGLCDGQRGVQVAQRLELPLLPVNGDEKLLDTLEGQLVLLHQNGDGVSHELLGHLQHLERHGGGENGHLHRLGHVFEDVVDLLLESATEHLICLIEHEQRHVLQTHGSAVDHVVHSARGAHDHLHALLQGADVVAHSGSAHTGHDLYVHEVSQRGDDLHDLLRQLASGCEDERLAVLDLHINLLQNADGKSSSLTSTGLGLSNHVFAHQGWLNSTLLNCRRLLKPIRVNSAQ
mmetsp:Transcript_22933/g.38244  ORF Transcript_22933/g.38244 Transcript_22933/m.38244 type:complete len:260 (-) Transcript_22933:257-1036(-)